MSTSAQTASFKATPVKWDPYFDGSFDSLTKPSVPNAKGMFSQKPNQDNPGKKATDPFEAVQTVARGNEITEAGISVTSGEYAVEAAGSQVGARVEEAGGVMSAMYGNLGKMGIVGSMMAINWATGRGEEEQAAVSPDQPQEPGLTVGAFYGAQTQEQGLDKQAGNWAAEFHSIMEGHQRVMAEQVRAENGITIDEHLLHGGENINKGNVAAVHVDNAQGAKLTPAAVADARQPDRAQSAALG
jgi:hypothetical protein